MPDWITHVLVAWTLATILGFRFKEFSQPNSVIVILGALIPDLVKINILLWQLGLMYYDNFVVPIHLPIGSLLIAGLITLFFEKRKLIFSLLSIGILTHYSLDLLLFGGGIELLYPLNYIKWQIGIISVTDFNITLISVVIALVTYLIYKTVNNTKMVFS